MSPGSKLEPLDIKDVAQDIPATSQGQKKIEMPVAHEKESQDEKVYTAEDFAVAPCVQNEIEIPMTYMDAQETEDMAEDQNDASHVLKKLPMPSTKKSNKVARKMKSLKRLTFVRPVKAAVTPKKRGRKASVIRCHCKLLHSDEFMIQCDRCFLKCIYDDDCEKFPEKPSRCEKFSRGGNMKENERKDLRRDTEFAKEEVEREDRRDRHGRILSSP
ncbi:unnamed protein product [Soboliphyme baturini]|uniref:CXXC-type domain-containing protein n=1 Tax=Soboliphyme baturini TaxID=241478 RepID=A0A183IM39_9BILA|nr:unnamed protein product [Soboliphyme baturini]